MSGIFTAVKITSEPAGNFITPRKASRAVLTEKQASHCSEPPNKLSTLDVNSIVVLLWMENGLSSATVFRLKIVVLSMKCFEGRIQLLNKKMTAKDLQGDSVLRGPHSFNIHMKGNLLLFLSFLLRPLRKSVKMSKTVQSSLCMAKGKQKRSAVSIESISMTKPEDKKTRKRWLFYWTCCK
ncbi:hypothetical protein P5673_024246 [Acropora cervicornis]|uniref:Uncharacterized protein n=1 Tax=Acropora cervicornis TaxID=6130 RepID=A0AAD9Q479_ACRCE|nr:hypothetical protein P5673_024246 [Acropora cervicornis]